MSLLLPLFFPASLPPSSIFNTVTSSSPKAKQLLLKFSCERVDELQNQPEYRFNHAWPTPLPTHSLIPSQTLTTYFNRIPGFIPYLYITPSTTRSDNFFPEVFYMLPNHNPLLHDLTIHPSAPPLPLRPFSSLQSWPNSPGPQSPSTDIQYSSNQTHSTTRTP